MAGEARCFMKITLLFACAHDAVLGTVIWRPTGDAQSICIEDSLRG